MRLVALNCPNCSAPLESGERAMNSRCSYCGTVVLSPKKKSAERAVLAERQAASLIAEVEPLQKAYTETSSALLTAQMARSSADSARNANYETRETARAESFANIQETRSALFASAGLSTLVALISGWIWPWIVAVCATAVGAVFQAMLRTSKVKEQEPLASSPSADEIELESRLRHVKAEIEERIAASRLPY